MANVNEKESGRVVEGHEREHENVGNTIDASQMHYNTDLLVGGDTRFRLRRGPVELS